MSNKVGDVQPAETLEIEPHCSSIRGLFVPQTGIIDYGVVARKYAEKLTEMGAEIVLGEEVVDVRRRDNPIEVIGNNHTGTKLAAVVCVGLQSDGLARKTEPDLPLRILPFRGEYF